MKVWCDSVDVAASGKTAGTYDAVGTVTIRASGANHILGILASVADTKPTSGEGGAPIVQVNSQDLGISNQRFQLASIVTDGIGTHDKEAPVVTEFIPFKAQNGAKLGNAKIDISISTSVAKTEGYDAAIGILYSDSLPDQQFFVELMAGICARATGGGVAVSAAGVKAATATAFATGISVSSAAKELIGLLGIANTNAPTAAEAAVGVVEFTSSSIADFAPQKWPLGIAYTASLGTPVGTPVTASRRNGFYYPTRFPLPQVNFTMDVSMLFATALTNEADGIAGAKWR
jgi:hypothetical protein